MRAWHAHPLPHHTHHTTHITQRPTHITQPTTTGCINNVAQHTCYNPGSMNSPRDALDLINLLCTYNPDMRISAHRALRHRYFNLLKENTNDNVKRTPETIMVQTQPSNLTPVKQASQQSKQENKEPIKNRPVFKKNPNVNKHFSTEDLVACCHICGMGYFLENKN